MKIIIGIIGGGLFLIVTIILISLVDIDWRITLTLCTTAVIIGILIILYPKITKMKFGPHLSIDFAPNVPTIESKPPIETEDIPKFSPIIIHNVETLSQDFKDFIVEKREKGNNATLVQKTASGIKNKLKWKMVPLVFNHTKTGIKYEIRVCVQDLDGNKSGFTEWVTITAGE